jgi:N-acetylneuraminic acid mutarotase
MIHPRYGQTATLLQNGEVLVAGGYCNGGGGNCDSGSFFNNQVSAELYDPATGEWTATGNMSRGRARATATLLNDGNVLVAVGLSSCDDDFCFDLNEAEIYDPGSATWTKTGSFEGAREQQTANLMSNGSVLLRAGVTKAEKGTLGHTPQPVSNLTAKLTLRSIVDPPQATQYSV